MSNDIEHGSVGSSFEDFLKDEGRYEEATNQAIKRVLAFQLTEAMKEQKLSKVAMAKKMETSRSQLDRLLDPENESVTLGALARAASVLGREIRIELS